MIVMWEERTGQVGQTFAFAILQQILLYCNHLLSLNIINSCCYSDGLAVDWITNKLYFTDNILAIVGVFDPVHFFYRVLVPTGSNTKPRAIVLDPNTRCD